jgi:hypothetical protein
MRILILPLAIASLIINLIPLNILIIIIKTLI